MTTASPIRSDPAPSERPARSPGRVVLAVLGVLVMLLGLFVLGSGALALTVGSAVRDSDGFMMSDRVSWTSPGYAVQSETVELEGGTAAFNVPSRLLGELRAEAWPTGDNGVFIGIASARDVNRYLRGVARTTIDNPYTVPSDSDFVDGGSPRVAPTDADFWVASAVGTGPQTITWDPQPGRWRLVVMNVEGTTPVSADVAVGAELRILRSIAWAAIVAGVLILALGAVPTVVGLRKPR